MDVAQWELNQVMMRVSEWMAEHGLSLTVQKTEIVVLTTTKIETINPLQVGNQEIVTKKA